MKTVEEIVGALIEKAKREADAGRAHAEVIREKLTLTLPESVLEHRRRSLAETEEGAADKDREVEVLTDLLALHTSLVCGGLD